MKKWISFAAAMLAVTAFSVGTADAKHHKRKVGKGVITAGIVTGAAATASYFWINNWEWSWRGASVNGISQGAAIATTTIGCMAVAPMLATLLENRPLTYREAHVLAGSCVIPIIGGYLVNAAYDANPQWAKYDRPAKRSRR